MSTALLWLVVIAAALILAAVLAVEEARVHDAQREAASWQPYDGDEAVR